MQGHYTCPTLARTIIVGVKEGAVVDVVAGPSVVLL